MSSNIPNEPGNRPARDYDRHIERLNAGEDEPILDPEEDADFVAGLVEGLRDLATKAKAANAAVAEFGKAIEPYAEDEDFVAGAAEPLSDFVERKA